MDGYPYFLVLCNHQIPCKSFHTRKQSLWDPHIFHSYALISSFQEIHAKCSISSDDPNFDL